LRLFNRPAPAWCGKRLGRCRRGGSRRADTGSASDEARAPALAARVRRAVVVSVRGPVGERKTDEAKTDGTVLRRGVGSVNASSAAAVEVAMRFASAGAVHHKYAGLRRGGRTPLRFLPIRRDADV